MEILKLLKINKLVQIEVLDEEGLPTKYRSRIENINEKGITLASPMKKRFPIIIPKGSMVDILFWDCTAVYQFRSEVLDNFNVGVPQVVISIPEEIFKVQNRGFVRVPSSLNILIYFKNKNDEIEEHHCRSRDISGGGILLITPKGVQLKKEQEITLKFKLGKDSLELMGEVVWINWELDRDGLEREIIGIMFTEINERYRQNIVKYVFNRQIELRRKGLL